MPDYGLWPLLPDMGYYYLVEVCGQKIAGVYIYRIEEITHEDNNKIHRNSYERQSGPD